MWISYTGSVHLIVKNDQLQSAEEWLMLGYQAWYPRSIISWTPEADCLYVKDDRCVDTGSIFFKTRQKMSSVRWTAALLSISPSCLACTSRIHSWCQILRPWTNNNKLMSRAPADKLLITQPTRVPLSSKRVTYDIVATTTQRQSRQHAEGDALCRPSTQSNNLICDLKSGFYLARFYSGYPSLASDAHLAQVQLGTNRRCENVIHPKYRTKQDQDTKIRPNYLKYTFLQTQDTACIFNPDKMNIILPFAKISKPFLILVS